MFVVPERECMDGTEASRTRNVKVHLMSLQISRSYNACCLVAVFFFEAVHVIVVSQAIQLCPIRLCPLYGQFKALARGLKKTPSAPFFSRPPCPPCWTEEPFDQSSSAIGRRRQTPHEARARLILPRY